MKLSICIPTYNRKDLLRQTLLSLLPQLSEEMEIVVSDNASIDGTDTMIAELMRRYAQIRYHRWPENMGADRNYLRAVEAAHGEYCWLFGSDDLVQPGAVNRVLGLLADHCDIYLFNRMEWYEDKDRQFPTYWLRQSVPSRVFDFTEDDARREYFDSALEVGALFGYLSSIVVRRAAWFSIRYDESYTGTAYSHAFILLSLIKAGCRLRYDSRHLVDCRLGNDSFGQGGVFRRVMLDLVGYGKIRDDVFRSDANLRRAINKVLHREYRWWKLASRRTSLNAQEWIVVRDSLRKTGYPPWLLFCADLLGRSRGLMRLLRWMKNGWLKSGPPSRLQCHPRVQP